MGFVASYPIRRWNTCVEIGVRQAECFFDEAYGAAAPATTSTPSSRLDISRTVKDSTRPVVMKSVPPSACPAPRGISLTLLPNRRLSSGLRMREFFPTTSFASWRNVPKIVSSLPPENLTLTSGTRGWDQDLIARIKNPRPHGTPVAVTSRRESAKCQACLPEKF